MLAHAGNFPVSLRRWESRTHTWTLELPVSMLNSIAILQLGTTRNSSVTSAVSWKSHQIDNNLNFWS